MFLVRRKARAKRRRHFNCWIVFLMVAFFSQREKKSFHQTENEIKRERKKFNYQFYANNYAKFPRDSFLITIASCCFHFFIICRFCDCHLTANCFFSLALCFIERNSTIRACWTFALESRKRELFAGFFFASKLFRNLNSIWRVLASPFNG